MLTNPKTIGHVYFSFESDKDLTFEYEFEPKDLEIEKVFLKCLQGKVELKIITKNIYAEDNLASLNLKARNFVSMLTIKRDIPSNNFRHCGFRLPYRKKDHSGLIKVYGQHISIVNFEEHKVSEKISNIDSVFDINITEDKAKIYHELATALSEVEPVTKFIMLYNIIQHYLGDSQKKVDDKIRKIQPNVEEFISPRCSNGKTKETIYSKLRNELNHKRNNSSPDLEQTKRTIIANLKRFTELAKIIIE